MPTDPPPPKARLQPGPTAPPLVPFALIMGDPSLEESAATPSSVDARARAVECTGPYIGSSNLRPSPEQTVPHPYGARVEEPRRLGGAANDRGGRRWAAARAGSSWSPEG